MTKTRVLTLMFHRVDDKSQNFDPQRFAHYLDYLVQNFPIVIPGDDLPCTPCCICLTFDDAYYDFYHHVYPLLQQYQIKALLAVPAYYILEDTTISAHKRLAVSYPQGMEQGQHETLAPFCTWNELKEMAQSNLVVMASHGFKHANLADKKVNLYEEIQFSQKLLMEKLNKPVRHFVYPYGKISKLSHKTVCQTYDYGIRIGGALNRGWSQKGGFIYRINADPLWTLNKPIDKALIKKLTFKYWMNRFRNK